MSKVRTILCAADLGGSESAVQTLAAAAESRDVDADLQAREVELAAAAAARST